MICRSVIASWMMLTTLAQAAPAPVQTGEHPEFTRVVVTLPPGAAWAVTQEDRTVTLNLPGFADGFLTAGFFDIIPRDRIADFRSTPNRLEITLNCDCRVAPFLVQDRYVVLDIAAADTILAVDFIPLGNSENPGTAPPRLTPWQNRLDSLAPRPLPQAIDTIARGPLPDVAAQTLTDVQQDIARGLARAATQGVLEPAFEPPVLTQPEQTEEDEQIETAPAPKPVRSPFQNVRITTSMDLPNGVSDALEQLTAQGRVCPSDSAVALASWGDGRPFERQLSEARIDLFNDMGRLDQSAALNLARMYLHFGFGAEAEDTLNLSPELKSEHGLLIDIARILETGSADEASDLRALTHCEGDIALWAVLAAPLADTTPSIDPAHANLALSKLPLHLRKVLAPALSKRFLDNGDLNAASTALRKLIRTPDPLQSDARLAQARISLEQGQTDLGTRQLSDVVDDNSPQSPEALIAYVDTRLESDTPLDPDTAALVAAYATELQGSALGDDLRRAHVLALAKSGQFNAAFDAARQLGGFLEDEAAIALRLQLLSELTKFASDIDFLNHTFAKMERDVPRLPRQDRLAVAKRLLELGFPEHTQRVLASLPDRPRRPDRQLLAARTALALAQPMLAQAELVQIDGVEAIALRAEAKVMTGDYAQAYALLEGSQVPADVARRAWLAENILDQSLSADPVFAPLVDISQVQPDNSTDITGMLSRGNNMLTESEKARATLTDFLRAPDLSAGADN